MCPRDVYSKLRWIKLDVCLLCTGDIAIRHSTVCAVTLNEICVESIEERCLETRRLCGKSAAEEPPGAVEVTWS